MTTPNKKPYKDDHERKFKCHARRHMTASEYKTYDSMIAMSLSGKADGVCYASQWTIANHSGQNIGTVRDNIKSLVKSGWLIPEGQGHWHRGEWSTNKYSVLEHDEFGMTAECPPFKYDPVTGKHNFKGVLKPGLVRYLASKKASDTAGTDGETAAGNPATVTRILVADNG